MEFQASTLWWVLAGVLVIAELLTGTFYLLMLALGSVAAAGAAHAGAGAPWPAFEGRGRAAAAARVRSLTGRCGLTALVSIMLWVCWGRPSIGSWTAS